MRACQWPLFSPLCAGPAAGPYAPHYYKNKIARRHRQKTPSCDRRRGGHAAATIRLCVCNMLYITRTYVYACTRIYGYTERTATTRRPWFIVDFCFFFFSKKILIFRPASRKIHIFRVVSSDNFFRRLLFKRGLSRNSSSPCIRCTYRVYENARIYRAHREQSWTVYGRFLFFFKCVLTKIVGTRFSDKCRL